VSWLPGQILDRNTAITAMTLAGTTADGHIREGHRLWPHIRGGRRTRPDRTPGRNGRIPATRRHQTALRTAHPGLTAAQATT
jgi:hypothetical protein